MNFILLISPRTVGRIFLAMMGISLCAGLLFAVSQFLHLRWL